MALACGIQPDHSTLAGFVGKLRGRIEMIFSEVRWPDDEFEKVAAANSASAR
jgi:hypothetical protein